MILRTIAVCFFVALVAIGVLQPLLCAQDANDEELRDAWSVEYAKLANATQITSLSNPAPITVNPTPLMKWHNSVRGNGTTSGDFFVWVRGKQPVAVGTFFSYVPSTPADKGKRKAAMAFHALVVEDLDIQVNATKRTLFGTKLHQIEYHADETEVAKTAVRRLQQMRSLAKECEASTILEGQKEPLRLLPQPLLTIGGGETERGPADGNEAALFAMVTGTDPEVLFLIQAVESKLDQKAHWSITPARFTDLPFEITVGKKKLWESAFTTNQTPFVSVHGLFLKPLDPR